MSFGCQQHLDIKMFKDAHEATAAGYVYRSPTKGLEIKKVVVVKDGTEGHNATVDLLLHDLDGNEYVVMITAALLKSIPC